MHDRPTMEELLDVVQHFLDEEVVPATGGRTQFLVRVAANCVRMVGRELASEPEHFERAWSGLDRLLGAEPPPEERGQRREALEARLGVLSERIRTGAFDAEGELDQEVLAFVRATVRDKLKVSNPRLLAADAERGIE